MYERNEPQVWLIALVQQLHVTARLSCLTYTKTFMLHVSLQSCTASIYRVKSFLPFSILAQPVKVSDWPVLVPVVIPSATKWTGPFSGCIPRGSGPPYPGQGSGWGSGETAIHHTTPDDVPWSPSWGPDPQVLSLVASV